MELIGQPEGQLDWAIEFGVSRPRPVLDDDRVSLEATADGVEVYTGLDGNLDAVRLLAPGFRGSRGYSGRLSMGLRFGMTRTEVRELLGTPRRSKDAVVIRLLDPVNPWPAWDSWLLSNGVEVHCSYPNDALGSVSVQVPLGS